MRELLEELDRADITRASSAPYVEESEGDGLKLVVEGIRIPLTNAKLEQALAWALSFPTFQQILPAGGGGGSALRFTLAFVYRYALGVNRGPRLPNRFLRKAQSLIK